jgi:hypothetical protein
MVTAFSDSLLAYEFAVRQGFEFTGQAKTSSPTFILSNRYNVRDVEEDLSRNDYLWIQQTTEQLSSDVFQACKDQGKSYIGIVAARIIVQASTIITKALCLKNADLSSDNWFITILTGNPAFDAQRNSPIAKLLEDHCQEFRVNIKPADIDLNFDPDRNHPNFFLRLKSTGWPRLGYRIFEKLWQWLPVGFSRGNILVTRENPLLRETAYTLALSGHAITQLPLYSPNISSQEPEDLNVQLVETVISPILDKILGEKLIPEMKISVCRLLEEKILAGIVDFFEATVFWASYLDHSVHHKNNVVFANAPYRPSDVALFSECKRRNISFVAFQHGVSKEIDNFHSVMNPVSEIATCDVCMSFNKKRSELSDNLEYAVGTSFTAGAPEEYRSPALHRKRNNSSPSVHFYSTLLLQENINPTASKTTSDVDLVNTEIALVENVLAKLPYDVLYKPYPEHRYIDENPLDSVLRNHSNIKVHMDGQDLTYLLPDAELIVTSQATSTVSWCLMSGKPLVFIDFKDQCPLRPDIREAFEEAVFVFDGDAPSFHFNLCEFLSKDVMEISELWRQKADSRARAMQSFIAANGSGAGKRAAKRVKEEMHHQSSGVIQ